MGSAGSGAEAWGAQAILGECDIPSTLWMLSVAQQSKVEERTSATTVNTHVSKKWSSAMKTPNCPYDP